MTQTSYNNYVSNMMYHYKEYAPQIEKRMRVGDCKSEDMLMNLAILHTYIDILACFKLCQYDSDGLLHCENCLSISQMQSITYFLNNFFGVNYCIDFIDGDNPYGPVICTTCPDGTYTTTIDSVDNSTIWVSGNIMDVIKDNSILLSSCDGTIVYIDTIKPLTFGLSIEGNTYLTFDKADLPSSWDRNLLYCMTINP